MASSLIKFMGFIYYTIATTSLMILLNFFLRLSRRPNSQFFITGRIIYKSLITFYSLINLFICYFFFSNKIYGYAFYIINELVTIAFSYFILAGFHVYGITGQICSGKSLVCDYLKRKYNASIISLDDINRQIIKQKPIIQQIKKEFGNEVISIEYGREVINKSALKKIIFNDKSKRKKLESITHPKIMMAFFQTLFRERFVKMKKLVFIENAILLRFNLFRMILRGIIAICVSDENILIQRMMKRDNNKENNVNEETAKNILKNQMSLVDFKMKSDIVIYNDDNYQNLELKIDNLIGDILKYTANDKIFVL